MVDLLLTEEEKEEFLEKEPLYFRFLGHYKDGKRFY